MVKYQSDLLVQTEPEVLIVKRSTPEKHKQEYWSGSLLKNEDCDVWERSYVKEGVTATESAASTQDTRQTVRFYGSAVMNGLTVKPTSCKAAVKFIHEPNKVEYMRKKPVFWTKQDPWCSSQGTYWSLIDFSARKQNRLLTSSFNWTMEVNVSLLLWHQFRNDAAVRTEPVSCRIGPVATEQHRLQHGLQSARFDTHFYHGCWAAWRTVADNHDASVFTLIKTGTLSRHRRWNPTWRQIAATSSSSHVWQIKYSLVGRRLWRSLSLRPVFSLLVFPLRYQTDWWRNTR